MLKLLGLECALKTIMVMILAFMFCNSFCAPDPCSLVFSLYWSPCACALRVLKFRCFYDAISGPPYLILAFGILPWSCTLIQQWACNSWNVFSLHKYDCQVSTSTRGTTSLEESRWWRYYPIWHGTSTAQTNHRYEKSTDHSSHRIEEHGNENTNMNILLEYSNCIRSSPAKVAAAFTKGSPTDFDLSFCFSYIEFGLEILGNARLYHNLSM